MSKAKEKGFNELPNRRTITAFSHRQTIETFTRRRRSSLFSGNLGCLKDVKVHLDLDHVLDRNSDRCRFTIDGRHGTNTMGLQHYSTVLKDIRKRSDEKPSLRLPKVSPYELKFWLVSFFWMDNSKKLPLWLSVDPFR